MKTHKALLTALCSVLLCLSVLAQNTPPYQTQDTLHVVSHNGPFIFNLSSVAADAEGNPLHVHYVWQPSYGTVNFTPPYTFTYNPPAYFEGVDNFSIFVCDTVAGQISLCESIDLYMEVDSFYPLLTANTNLINDTVCIGTPITYAMPLVSGGSGNYNYYYASSDGDDVISSTAFGDSVTITKAHTSLSTITITVQDFNAGYTFGPYNALQLYANDTLRGEFTIDNSERNKIWFFTYNTLPNHYHYGMIWENLDSVMGSWYLPQNNLANSDSLWLYYSFGAAATYYPYQPGFVQLTIIDSITGCISRHLSPYDGINHGLYGDPPVLSTSTNAISPVLFEYSYWNNWQFVSDIDQNSFTYYDTLTSPRLGTISWENSSNGPILTYTPGIDTCGIDSFYVLTKDQSPFQPYNYIDTVLAIVHVSCAKVARIDIATPITCAGDSNAVLSVTTNVLGTLTYNWSNGANTPTITNAGPGQYRVTVTNEVNQSATALLNVNAPSVLNLTSTAQNISCYGGTNGRILNYASGGTYPYTFSINGGPLVTGNFTNLLEGNYFVMVADDRGCTDTGTYFINEPDSLIASASGMATCGTTCSGVGTVVAQGGTPPYSYTWPNGQNNATINTLCADSTYVITVRDSKFCLATVGISVTQGTNPLTLSFTEQHIDCNHLTGSLTAIPANGTAPYTYMWSDFTTGQAASNLSIGTYNVVVQDANGCQIDGTDSILNISGLSVSILHSTNPTCPTSLNGGAKVSVAGGVAPYSYVWQGNPSTADTASGLGVGQHAVTVSDAAGCSYIFTFTLTAQSNIIFNDSVVPKFCTEGQKGEIFANAHNGISPYSYQWAHNASVDAHQADLAVGSYTYTVTDAYGCTASNSNYVSQYSYHISAWQIPDNCQMDNGTVKVHTYGGLAPYSYVWNTTPILTGDSISHLTAGPYQVTVTDAVGCKRTGYVILKNSCYSTIAGNVFYDDNGNCLLDTSEAISTQFIKVRAFDGFNSYYSSVNPYGTYSIKVHQIGNYQVSIVYDDCYIACNGGMVNVTVMDSVFDGPDIGVRFDPNAYDLAVHLNGGTPNAGFNTNYYINAMSLLDNGLVSGTVTLVYDAGLSYVSSTPAPSSVNTFTHTITWNVNNIPYAGSGIVQLMAVMHVDVAATVGQSFTSTASISPTANDCYIHNNKSHFSRQVAGAYDPNMKEVYPADEIVETDSILNYTIHFQNTGNDTTHFIILKDTLSNLVDPGSIELLGSSHQPCRFELSENGILTFTFDPIYLPDSATNEEGSKGFVSYSIKKKADAPVGEVIRNTAHIYFDFNPAIVTNTTENEVTTLVSVRDIKADDNLTAKVYPNPFSETATIELSEKLIDAKLAITNLAGQVVQEHSSESGNKWHISKQGLSQGMYTFTVYSGKIVKIRGKLIAE